MRSIAGCGGAVNLPVPGRIPKGRARGLVRTFLRREHLQRCYVQHCRENDHGLAAWRARCRNRVKLPAGFASWNALREALVRQGWIEWRPKDGWTYSNRWWLHSAGPNERLCMRANVAAGRPPLG